METKSTKKSVKSNPKYVVNLTDCRTELDVMLAFIYAKADAGIQLTRDEIAWIAGDTIIDMLYASFSKILEGNEGVMVTEDFEFIPLTLIKESNGDKWFMYNPANRNPFECDECPFKDKYTVKKKPNIFKRFWNWITGK